MHDDESTYRFNLCITSLQLLNDHNSKICLMWASYSFPPHITAPWMCIFTVSCQQSSHWQYVLLKEEIKVAMLSSVICISFQRTIEEKPTPHTCLKKYTVGHVTGCPFSQRREQYCTFHDPYVILGLHKYTSENQFGEKHYTICSRCNLSSTPTETTVKMYDAICTLSKKMHTIIWISFI